MRRGVVWVDHAAMAVLLRLAPEEYVITVCADWLRMSIGVVVAGPDLPDVPEAMPAPDLALNDYVDLYLREKILALIQRWDRSRDGISAVAVLTVLDQVLKGDFDPRIEMHGVDVA